MSIRELERVIPSLATSDGAGVKLRRSIGAGQGLRHDPFLMLDEFFSDNPDDYIAGFPAHPHRGFETVTYMLDGHMKHEDHLGNTGDLGPGGVQWMTAGRGIIHSEMPQQTEGRMRGFQLWINLPARDKMKPAGYRDIPAAEIPAVSTGAGGSVRLIAGRLEIDGQAVTGAVPPDAEAGGTAPIYADVRLAAGERFEVAVPEGHNAFVYVYDGDARIGADDRELPRRSAGLLSRGDTVRLTGGSGGAGLLLIAGRPLNEPVVQYGPFVMNTREEIEQALADYRDGRLAQA
jgi:redox-sensitive bicupin YhaK (pirin superfamily)